MAHDDGGQQDIGHTGNGGQCPALSLFAVLPGGAEAVDRQGDEQRGDEQGDAGRSAYRVVDDESRHQDVEQGRDEVEDPALPARFGVPEHGDELQDATAQEETAEDDDGTQRKGDGHAQSDGTQRQHDDAEYQQAAPFRWQFHLGQGISLGAAAHEAPPSTGWLC